MERVNFLAEEGHWSNDLADALPLAVSNLLHTIVRIFCSNRANPVYEIKPTVTTVCEEEPAVLNLAFLQMPGFEHYDACTAYRQMRSEVEGNANMSQINSTPSTKENTIVHNITPRKQAQYKSPKKFKGRQKRTSQPDKWKKFFRKQ